MTQHKVPIDDIDVWGSMNKSAGMTRVHGWRTKGLWMMRKRKKKAHR